MNFNEAFITLIDHEGGYVNNPNDPGKETKFGISKRAYPNLNIKDLTLAQAKEIYFSDYWEALQIDDLPEDVKFDVFDMAVNSGVTAAVKLMQKTAGVVEDGKLGFKTMSAIAAMNPYMFCVKFNANRLIFMTGLITWQNFGRGWARRVADNLLNLKRR